MIVSIKDIPISEMNFSPKVLRCLQKANITTLSQLNKYTFKELFNIQGLGEVSLYEIEDTLKEYGFKKLKETVSGEKQKPNSCLRGLNDIDYKTIIPFLDILPENERITIEYIRRDNKNVSQVAKCLGTSRQLIDTYLRNAMSRIGIHLLKQKR